jgi:hypothetical protein
MTDSPQRRALRNYRSRLTSQGMTRFEVLGRSGDRELIRKLARRLADEGDEAERLRLEMQRGLEEAMPKKGGILAALRRSPLVGAELDLERIKVTEREVEL